MLNWQLVIILVLSKSRMIMLKGFGFALFFATVGSLFSQNAIELANIDNVKITYTLTKLEAKETKDKYLIQVNLTNTNSYPIYYSVPGLVNADKSVTMDPFSLSFAKVKIRNSTGLFGDGIGLAGDNTQMMTTTNGFIHVILPGKIYNSETTFKVKKDEVPLVTNTIKHNLNKLSNYDIRINAATINGLWSSSCTTINMTLAFEENVAGAVPYILQSVNGKQIKWLKQTEITFTRENDNSTTLSYQKSSNTFLYSSADGISCTLTKKN